MIIISMMIPLLLQTILC